MTVRGGSAGGSRVGQSGEEIDLRVAGMDCAGCAATVENALKRLQGVENVSVDVVSGRVRVGIAARAADRRAMEKAVALAGYRVLPETELGRGRDDERASDRGRLVMTALSGVALLAALVLPRLVDVTWVRYGLLAVATVAGGWYVAPKGFRAALHRSLDMNFLMSIAALGAWIIGEQTEAAATLFLFAVAELLESYSMDRARNAIKALMQVAPADAVILRDSREERVPAASLAVGDVVVVRPGEKIPIDGDVIAGRSSVNQAPITGESIPVDKEEGSAVFAGTLNGQGAIQIRATKPPSDTTLARIIHAVEEAQGSRAPSQTFVDRFARAYTPAVVAVAVVVAVGPPLLGLGEWGTWIYRALAMLVVACPCALVISTPVSIVSGLAGAARAGILIKGGAHLENAGRVTVVAFDKTGTLTEGRPAVTDVESLSGASNDDIIRLALGVERHSEHPLARAILQYGADKLVDAAPSTDFEALPGRGARATVDGRTLHVGNERLAEELGARTVRVRETMARFEREGKTAVLLASASTPLAVIAIADRLRPEAAEAIRKLRRAGVKRTVMLTGDNEGTARGIAQLASVDAYYAALLPDDKVRLVREMEAAGESVAFIGDGINDAPALAAATVGVAMGVAGTDVALETADIALMGDDLSKLSFAIGLSRRTLRIIKQNIAVSIAVKAVFVVLAVGGWATLWMAVAADMGASLLVVANGLRGALQDRPASRRVHSPRRRAPQGS